MSGEQAMTKELEEAPRTVTPLEIAEWLEVEADWNERHQGETFVVNFHPPTLRAMAATVRTLLSALSRGDGWRPISEFVEKAYDDQILVGGADWDAPITIEAYQLRPGSIAKWTGAPTHYHTGIPLPPVPEGGGVRWFRPWTLRGLRVEAKSPHHRRNCTDSWRG